MSLPVDTQAELPRNIQVDTKTFNEIMGYDPVVTTENPDPTPVPLPAPDEVSVKLETSHRDRIMAHKLDKGDFAIVQDKGTGNVQKVEVLGVLGSKDHDKGVLTLKLRRFNEHKEPGIHL